MVTSITKNSAILNEKGQYDYPVGISILNDKTSNAMAITANGNRIQLQSFQGSYHDQLKTIFSDSLLGFSHEFEDMKEIFGDARARQHYADCKPQTDEKIVARIEFNAKRAFEGNPYTGYAIVEKTAQKIIGFVALGRGPQPGECRGAMILNPAYHRQHYGLEASILAGALLKSLTDLNFQIGKNSNKFPVQNFTVSALNDSEPSIKLIEKLGFKIIRELSSKEKYLDQQSDLYGISIHELETKLDAFIQPENIQIEYLNKDF